MNKLKKLLSLYFLFQSGLMMAQEKQVLLLDFNYGFGFPMQDLANRFGNHLVLGAGLSYQGASNWINFGTKFSYFFGNQLDENVLKPFQTSYEGLLIGADQYLSEMKLRERGYFMQAFFGGLIPIGSQANARQSLKWQMGAGFIQHHIRFVDDARALNQFTTDYLQGLDRLSNGFAIIPFIGYEYISRKNWLSFYTGVEPVFGFTQNQRKLNYDTNQSEFGINRKDFLVNFKMGIYLPFYLGNKGEEIEY
ncbi:MAG: hypothetical protein JNL65_13225 [Saprospiraceae bacterium]|nr:hypothetical protein [Saprospiraceae bacterium]HRG69519.1 hypothetical protein [Saprospiraceae bacterium]